MKAEKKSGRESTSSSVFGKYKKVENITSSRMLDSRFRVEMLSGAMLRISICRCSKVALCGNLVAGLPINIYIWTDFTISLIIYEPR